MEVVLVEAPDGDAFEVFLDVMSLFCCDQNYDPSSGWAKLTKPLESNYSITARKVVALYYQTYCYHYTEGKVAQAGIKLAAFKDYDKWNGVSGMDGRRKEIENLAANAAAIAKTWVGDKLPVDGRLAPLALKMIERYVKWIHTVHKHLDTEYMKLIQQHIAEEEALILLSEQVIIMYQQIQQVQSQWMEFMLTKGSKVAYMARCIWITCQVHQVMQDFVAGGLKNNPAISTAFVCFLTKQTSANIASGVNGQIKTLTDAVAMLKGSVSAATTAAKEATQAAKEANARATTANTNADAAKNGLNALYSKNSNLKRCFLPPRRTSSCSFTGVACTFTPLFPFIVVSGGWPNELLAALSLDSPLLGAYFPAKLHWYFKPRQEITSWFTPSDVQHSSFPEVAALLVSGPPAFIDGVLSRSGRQLRVVVSALLKLHGSAVRGLRKDRAAAKDVMRCHGLTVISFLDAEIGGATDACFVIKFGADLGSSTLPRPVAGLPRTLRHFVNGGTPGSFPPDSRVLQSSLPLLDNPPCKVLWHMDAVCGEGLFPRSRPLSLVYCPSHFFPWHWIRRPLALSELLWLHQLPLALDLLFWDLTPSGILPFKDSPPPDLFVSIFRQLWENGSEGGVSDFTVSLETPVPLETPPNVPAKNGGEGMRETLWMP